MKTLILYGSIHGCTERCSLSLGEKLYGEVTIVNYHNEIVLDLTPFQTIIIGGSIYGGTIQKEISSFCRENLPVLLTKRVGLFLCSMMKEEKAQIQLQVAFPSVLLAHAVAVEQFGGEIRWNNLNLMEKLMVKIVAKTEMNLSNEEIGNDVSTVSEDKIILFAKRINADLDSSFLSSQ